MIQRNKHPWGSLNNLFFAWCQLADALVRVLSFGFLFSDCQLRFSRYQAQKVIQQAKARRAKVG